MNLSRWLTFVLTLAVVMAAAQASAAVTISFGRIVRVAITVSASAGAAQSIRMPKARITGPARSRRAAGR